MGYLNILSWLLSTLYPYRYVRLRRLRGGAKKIAQHTTSHYKMQEKSSLTNQQEVAYSNLVRIHDNDKATQMTTTASEILNVNGLHPFYHAVTDICCILIYYDKKI